MDHQLPANTIENEELSKELELVRKEFLDLYTRHKEIVVAGTSFCKEVESIEHNILPEKVLIMKREPQNQYDPFAIAIYCDDIKIGFVPAEMNLVCSRLMDAGKLFFCRVVSKNWKNKWLKINANIYMVE